MYSSSVLPVPQDVLQRRNIQFTRDAWRAGVRPDRRTAHQMRELDISFALLSREVVQVQLGNTIVLASIACELVEALPTKPKHGFFHIQVRRLSHERDSAETRRSVTQLSAFLNRLFRGGVVDTEGLCVLPGRRVWSIAVDVHILNDEGNVLDAAEWAVLAVLQHERRPELTIRGEEVIIHPPQERDPVPLSLHHLPLCFTFAIAFDERRRRLETYTAKLRQGQDMATGISADAVSNSAGHDSSSGILAMQDTTNVAHALSSSGMHVRSGRTRGFVDLDVCTDGEGYKWLCHGEDESVLLVVDPSEEEGAAAVTTVTVAVNVEGQVMHVMQSAMQGHDSRRQAAMRGKFLWALSRAGVGMADSSDAH